MTASQALPEPRLERVADCIIDVAPPLDIGQTAVGRRRLIPITGGSVNGPLLFAKVLPGGADFQLITSATNASIQARYVLQTPEGEQIYLENTGIRVAPAEVVQRINQGLPVDPALVYFRSTPRFETAAPRWAWLMDCIFVGTGARHPTHVELSFFCVR
ncbi:MAG: hypothetical protein RLZZ618_2698 [Pseudomonadota bacterium]|jgi:hypothetical protein